MSTGELLRQKYNKTTGIDLSPIIVPFSKTVERIMQKIFDDDRCMLGAALERVLKQPDNWKERFKTDLNKLREYRNESAHPSRIIEADDVEEVCAILFEHQGYGSKKIKGMLIYLDLKLEEIE